MARYSRPVNQILIAALHDALRDREGLLHAYAYARNDPYVAEIEREIADYKAVLLNRFGVKYVGH